MCRPAWTDEYKVHSYEVDIHARATLPVICKYLQESAWNHAEHLQIGFSALLSKNLVWILSRQQIRIVKYPKWGEQITVETWPSGKDRLYCYRDFKVLDADKELLVSATSTWFAVDLHSRRPQRTDKYLDAGIISGASLFDERAIKITQDTLTKNVKDVVVGYQDLDVNEHVNNVRYVEWILTGFDVEFQKRHQVQQLDINYLSEARYNDTLSINVSQSGERIFKHQIVRKRDDVDVCRTLSCWQLI